MPNSVVVDDVADVRCVVVPDCTGCQLDHFMCMHNMKHCRTVGISEYLLLHRRDRLTTWGEQLDAMGELRVPSQGEVASLSVPADARARLLPPAVSIPKGRRKKNRRYISPLERAKKRALAKG